MDLPSPPSASLAPQLAQIRRRNPDLGPFFDEIVIALREAGVGAAAPKVGEMFPDFSLPTASGSYCRLGDLLDAGPVIVNFSRGRWCPYCVHEVSAWAAMLPDLANAGVRFVEITGETGGGARALGALLAASPHAEVAEVLCDVDHGVALSLGLTFFAGDPLLDFYSKAGINMHELYGSPSGFLPVPATFAIDPAGRVRFAYTNVDFRERAEPAEVLAALREA
ncbi:redoxin domain-containing protein [Novosphingobium sp.]|uniref:redoxin domain-containing protein n=1 Tax=Novosphingobium sp. TaxID=1874826 RepID=UPI00261B1FD8|nr:redoxin domain-containing protein [Novosphingobium sp.]